MSRRFSIRLMPHEIVALLYVAVSIVLLERLPLHYTRIALVVSNAFGIALMFAVAAAVSWYRNRTDRQKWRRELLDIGRCCLLLLLVFSTSFVVKSFIHAMNPHVWDREFFALDRAMHFGYSPTIFLATLLQNPLFLRILDIYYSQLYFVLFVGVPGFLLAYLDRQQRIRFAAAFALMWIAGNILYVLLPSWGPVFTVSALVEAPLSYMPSTVWVQSQLFQELSSLVRDPQAPRVVHLGGVAAFPSLHVATVTLLALASRKVLPTGYLLLIVAVILMQIGSVITGYHFMLDGYAGALLAAGAWWVARPIAARASGRPLDD